MIGAGLRLTICSKPRWNGSRKPVRVMAPSAKMQTTSPRARASLAARRALMMPRGPPWLSMGMTRARRSSSRRNGTRVNGAQMMKRTGRFWAMNTRKASMKLTWLQTNRAGPVAGMFSRPKTRMR
jgi:hypothetical protein